MATLNASIQMPETVSELVCRIVPSDRFLDRADSAMKRSPSSHPATRYVPPQHVPSVKDHVYRLTHPTPEQPMVDRLPVGAPPIVQPRRLWELRLCRRPRWPTHLRNVPCRSRTRGRHRRSWALRGPIQINRPSLELAWFFHAGCPLIAVSSASFRDTQSRWPADIPMPICLTVPS